MTDNPMRKAHEAPRCTARCKRTGLPCKAPAVRGWNVCRMHGARGGAPSGAANGNYRHGASTQAAKDEIALARQILAEASKAMKGVCETPQKD